MGRLRLPYRGQRLAGAASEVFLHLLKARRAGPARISRGRPRRAGPPVQALRGPHHQSNLRAGPRRPRPPVLRLAGPGPPALCLECHRNKTALEFSHPTTLESRFSRRAYKAYVESPRLPPLVFHMQSYKTDRICQLVRQAGSGLHAREENRYVEELFVEPGRHGARGPGVRGPGPAANGGGVARARGALRQAVGQRPHRALGAQRGPGLHDAHQQPRVRRLRLPVPRALRGHRGGDALGPHLCEAAPVQQNWRPVHDFVMASEYVAVARIRDALATVPARYLKAVKTDCVVFQDLPKKYQPLVDKKHPDGTPVYRLRVSRACTGSPASRRSQ